VRHSPKFESAEHHEQHQWRRQSNLDESATLCIPESTLHAFTFSKGH